MVVLNQNKSQINEICEIFHINSMKINKIVHKILSTLNQLWREAEMFWQISELTINSEGKS